MQNGTILALALTALVVAASPALANAQADVDSAVTALHNRDYDQAITLLPAQSIPAISRRTVRRRPISTAAPPI